MRIERRYTKAHDDPYQAIEFRQTTSEIRNPDGSVVFRLEGIEVPASWSQVAADILAQKYFRKAGLPRQARRVAEEGVPEWLQRSEPVEGGAVGGRIRCHHSGTRTCPHCARKPARAGARLESRGRGLLVPALRRRHPL